ncbi:MAG: hypothetical protein M3Z54_12595, partial [Gemmatimonadota bacterium]|nr:hypothetical protein [Gemmatimonadota bacterium]
MSACRGAAEFVAYLWILAGQSDTPALLPTRSEIASGAKRRTDGALIRSRVERAERSSASPRNRRSAAKCARSNDAAPFRISIREATGVLVGRSAAQ